MRPSSGARGPRDGFESVDEAVKALRALGKAFVPPGRRFDEAGAAEEAISALALRGSAHGRMMDWAREAAPRLAAELRYVINQEQYDMLCKRHWRELLRRRGEEGPRGKLCFGLASRAVDLLMLRLGESESHRWEPATPFLRVPLDARTLVPIRRIVDVLADVDFSLEIPARPTIGYVATEEQYYVLQGAIAELASQAGIPSILYAYWCARG